MIRQKVQHKNRKDAEAQALAQGEKLEQAAAADREQQWDRTNKENENLDLIGGKFKNQEELLKAYQELEKQRSQEAPEDTSEGDTEDESESTETDSEETTETNPVLSKAADEYQDSGQLSEESIDELSKMDSKDLIKAYVDFYTKLHKLETYKMIRSVKFIILLEARKNMQRWFNGLQII